MAGWHARALLCDFVALWDGEEGWHLESSHPIDEHMMQAAQSPGDAMHAVQTLFATGSAAISTPYQLVVANRAYTAVSGAWNWVFSGLSGGAARGSVTQVPPNPNPTPHPGAP